MWWGRRSDHEIDGGHGDGARQGVWGGGQMGGEEGSGQGCPHVYNVLKCFMTLGPRKASLSRRQGDWALQCRHWRCCDKHFTKTTALKTHELFHIGENYKGGKKPMCVYVSFETSTQALWLCFRWKPLFLASFCDLLEHCVTLRWKSKNNWQNSF